MKKRVLKFTALAIVLGCTAVNAENINENKISLDIFYPNDDRVLVISGNAGAEENVSVRVLALGEDGDEFLDGEGNLQGITDADIRDNPGLIDYFNIIKSSADGAYEFKYKTEGESGFYLFTVTAADGQQETKLYEYYSPDYAVQKISELNTYIKNKEFENMSAFLKRFTQPLAADNKYFNQIIDETYFEELAPIISEGGEVKDKADLRQRIRIASARACLGNFVIPEDLENKTDIEEMLEYFTDFGLAEDDIYNKTFQKTVLKDVKSRILKDFADIDAESDTEMKKQIDDKILLGAVNYSAWGKIQTVIEENLSLFSASVQSDYNNLSVAKKADAAKNIAEEVKKSPYKTFSEFENGLKNSISSQIIIPPEPRPGGGSGSGSGGGKSSGYMPVTNVKPNQEENNNDGNISGGNENQNKNTFSDLTSAEWSREAVEYLAGEGIVSGRTKTEFAPNDNITREEFLAIAVRAFGLMNENAECSFSDVPDTAWFYSAVASAYNSGITSGLSETLFGAGTNITRQDMCVLAYKAAEKAGISLDAGSLEFSDSEEISDYAKAYAAAMSKAGIVNGVGNNRFAPKDTATRASAAKIIYGLLQLK